MRFIDAVKEVFRYKEFLKYLTLAKLKIRHKGTALGYVWWLLDPLILMLIYYMMVKVIFKRGGPDYLVFLFIALLSWRWFSSSLTEAATSIRSKASLIKQVYFPKHILVISCVLSNTVNFMFGIVILILLLVLFKIQIGINILFFPLLILIQLIFTLGIALILANIDAYLKDTGNLIKYVLQIWFFLSPGIYGLDLVPERFSAIYMLNPFTILFISFRDSIMYNQLPNLFGLFVLLLTSVLLVIYGFWLVSKNQGNYAKVL